jgi:hypothetical protein
MVNLELRSLRRRRGFWHSKTTWRTKPVSWAPLGPRAVRAWLNQPVELDETMTRAFLCHAPPKNGKSSIKPLDDFDTPWEVAPRVACLTHATLFGKFS